MHTDSYSNQSEMIVLPLSRLCFHQTVITNIQYKPMNIILTLHRFLPAGGQPVCCRRVNSGGLTVWFIWCLGRCPVGRQGRGFFLAFKTNVWYIYLWWALPQIMFLGVNYTVRLLHMSFKTDPVLFKTSSWTGSVPLLCEQTSNYISYWAINQPKACVICEVLI